MAKEHLLHPIVKADRKGEWVVGRKQGEVAKGLVKSVSEGGDDEHPLRLETGGMLDGKFKVGFVLIPRVLNHLYAHLFICRLYSVLMEFRSPTMSEGRRPSARTCRVPPSAAMIKSSGRSRARAAARSGSWPLTKIKIRDKKNHPAAEDGW